MKTIILILIALTVLWLFAWFACNGDTVELTDEQAEEARKKLLEQQDKDINLDVED